MSKVDVLFCIRFSLYQMMLLLVLVKHTQLFLIFTPTFLHCVLPKLIEVEYVEMIETYYRIDYLRK